MNQELQDVVGRDNLELVKTLADGNCQFDAVRHQLTSRFPDKCPSHLFTHEFVRSLAVAGVENMTNEQQETFHADLVGDKRNKLDENSSFETCLAKLRESGTWGNHVTLQAIAYQLRDQVFEKDVKIVVYTSSGRREDAAKTWDDSVGNPVESTVVTLCLGFVGEVHYYSTQALGCAKKRGRMDDDGGGSGSKRVALGSEKDGGPGGSDGSGDESDDSFMVTLGNDDDNGDDSSSGDGEDDDNDEDGGDSSASKPGFIPPTPKSGKLYTSVPLSVFDGGAGDNGNRSMLVVTQTGRAAGLWTMWPEGDGMFRLFPLLEGPSSGQSYVSETPPPSRSRAEGDKRSLHGHEGCLVLNVNLDTLNHTIHGPGDSTILIPLLRRISTRFKRDDVQVIDEVVRYMKKWTTEQIKECHNGLATDRGSEQSPLAESDRRLAETAHRDLEVIVDAGDVSEEEDADLQRKQNKRNARNYRGALHEGGRRWLLHALLSSFSDLGRSELEQYIPIGSTGEDAPRTTVQDICDSPWDHSDVLLQFFGDAAGSAGDMELFIRSMCPRPGREADNLCARILESIGTTAPDLGITSRGLMGEAFELFSALSWKQKGTTSLRDYIDIGRREQEVGGDQQNRQQTLPGFVSCRVMQCFMSEAPRESSFRMRQEDCETICHAIRNQVSEELQTKAENFVDELYEHMSRDHGYDVLVWLKEEVCQSTGESDKQHFLLLQCKARSDLEAKVDPSKYIADTYNLQLLATDVGCLAPLVWCSNVIFDSSLSRYQMSMSRGHIIPWLLPIICGESSAYDLPRRIGLGAVRLGMALDRPEPEDTLPPRLRPHQIAAVADLSAARRRGIRCGVANMATGSGKTVTACEDTLQAEAENEVILSLSSLCIAPGIELVLQVAAEWRSWEHRRKQGDGCPTLMGNEDMTQAERSAWVAAGNLPFRNFYYVVCSASDEDVASAHLRVIRVAELPATLERHWADGTLGLCRFFTTIEGGASFWYQTRKFNLLRGEQPTAPVFGVFVRDEVHKMCGVNSSSYALGLNVPALWMPSYTATPITEESRAELIRRTMKAGMRSAKPRGDEENEPDVYLDEEEEQAEEEKENDLDENEAAADQPTKRQKRMDNTSADDLFPQVHHPGMADGLQDTALKKAVERHGLHGIQLLPGSLLFEDLERVAARNDIFSDVWKAIEENGSYFKEPAYREGLERRIGKSVAIFAVVPSASGEEGMYDVKFDFSRRNFRVLHEPIEKIAMEHLVDSTCVVLGLYNSPNGSVFSCVEFTDDKPPVGAVVHDCTSFSPGTNLVGPILSKFSFAECFASGSLAKPGLALSDRGLLRVPPGLLTEQVQVLLQAWAGVTCSEEESTGVSIEDPRKVFLSATVGPRQGGHGRQEQIVIASAHDFHCMNHLLDLFVCTEQEHRVRPITKAIVFCQSSQVARRCMAVFRVLANLRLEREPRRADVYGSIVSAHVFQSDVSNRDLKQSYEVRRKLIWRFRGAKRAVLFNVDLLSTGIDLPCCDCVYLQCPSTNSNVVLQRWGRALRRTSNPEKVGLLALPCTDPYEPDEDQREEWRRIGLDESKGFDRDQRAAFYSKYDLTCRLVECAIDPRNLALGQLISVVAGVSTAAKDAQVGGRTRKLESFLKLMISCRGDRRQSVMHVSHADLSLLQKCTRVVGQETGDAAWRRKIQGLYEWYNNHEKKWPRTSMWEDEKRITKYANMTSEQIVESKFGKVLNHARCGRTALLRGKIGVRGMTQSRLDYLNATLPEGWEDYKAGDENWRARVQAMYRWYKDNLSKWPRSAIREGKKQLTNARMTPEQKEEVRHGRFLAVTRVARSGLLSDIQDPEKRSGMTQERLKYLDTILPKGWEDPNTGDEEWRAKVRELLAWYTNSGRKWPRSGISERKTGRNLTRGEMTPELQEEVRQGLFLRGQRWGLRAMLSGKKEMKKLQGMTQDRLDYLNATLPEGWEESSNIEQLLAWYTKNGDWPRANISENGKCLAICKLTPDQHQEVKLGRHLSKLRAGRTALLGDEETSEKPLGITQDLLEELNATLPEGWEDSTYVSWRASVEEARKWYENNGKKWPRQVMKRGGRKLSRKELTPAEAEEIRWGKFLMRQRRGRTALFNDETDSDKLRGMTPSRVAFLDKTLPGWEDRS